MKTLDEQIAIMTACKNGAAIECAWYKDRSKWERCNPGFLWDWGNFDFRVAEPVRKPREVKLLVWPSGNLALDTTGGWLPSGLRFDSVQFAGCEPMLFREVLPSPESLIQVRFNVEPSGGSGVFLHRQHMIIPNGRKLVVGETIDFVEVPK